MKLFLYRFAKFISIGFISLLVLLVAYFFLDPFKVIGDYQDYSHLRVVANRDYISTTMFLQNRKKQCYDAFIFGSSRTMAYRPNVWKQYLPETSHPFVFDASAEKLYGIYTKIKFLDSIGQPINQALIVLCRDVSFENSKKHEGHLYLHHPAVTHESWLDFHLTFIKAYLSPAFLIRYYSFLLTQKYQPWMKDYIQDKEESFDPLTNAIDLDPMERDILKNPQAYYTARKNIFYSRPFEEVTQDSISRISDQDIIFLHQIAKILKKNKTDYKVIVSPLYEQLALQAEDKKQLVKIFGCRLYDYSGQNKFNQNQQNFYETSHYRPHVGHAILKEIYHPN